MAPILTLVTLVLPLAVDSFDNTIEKLKALGTTFHQAPTLTEWGEMAVVADPEGRKIELYKKNMPNTSSPNLVRK
jgi:predicted enzyme related to lactoylglutathione lyase